MGELVCICSTVYLNCIWGVFTVDRSMIYKLGGFCYLALELRDQDLEPLSTVCSDVETEPVLQDITGEQLSGGSNEVQDARL